MFNDIKFNKRQAINVQVYNYIKEIIENGMLPSGSKLPSTREMSIIMKISRTTIMRAYELLNDCNMIYTVKGKGTFVSKMDIATNNGLNIKWGERISNFAINADELDIMKHEKLYKKGMISFSSIAPDESLFDIEELKRSFLNSISIEGKKILNYGYARGYKPLINFLMKYMEDKGVNTKGKNILITNGFTEGFDIVLSSITENGDKILCENPTHNTAIKLMKLHQLKIIGIDVNEDGIDINKLDKAMDNNIKAAYLIPSYHNPTGMVMSYKKREEVYSILKKYNIPIIEDGFNEELQNLGTHISPIAAISGEGNSVIYIGSLSKILFPGMRIGWIFADDKLIDILESVKRSRNIHTSFLDQGILYEYMKSGSFERYIKRIRNIYKEKFELIRKLAKDYIPHKFILGDGGLYIFIKLDGIKARDLLERCYKRNVIFMPGNIFYINDSGEDTIRIGFSKTSIEDIKKGIMIIGEEAKNINNNHVGY
ncbi:PLP-dependent aminotransferase family protein [Clostridium estertheticum]|uniref:aminotransferase-like domain-containing protein n=1 Tax=Clostridium estertheticum TaxID=238834 RepID=UPI001C7D26AF|nr:PLP-dependent aminotransferase family protein [Clostridium estertheticum]MBX4261689.1 PLP-dependent aminotransferase family protein [Clostridium estertheticum]WLC68599.1 PLP-dependent aminotransferase family protein [Clostridium estertheticum]